MLAMVALFARSVSVGYAQAVKGKRRSTPAALGRSGGHKVGWRDRDSGLCDEQ